MIPKVRQWIVTTTTGAKWIVLAPTRVLARLNFLHYYPGYTPIQRIGRAVKTRNQPDNTYIIWIDK